MTDSLSSVFDSGAQSLSLFRLPVSGCYYYRDYKVEIRVRLQKIIIVTVRVSLRASGRARSIGLLESGED